MGFREIYIYERKCPEYPGEALSFLASGLPRDNITLHIERIAHFLDKYVFLHVFKPSVSTLFKRDRKWKDQEKHEEILKSSYLFGFPFDLWISNHSPCSYISAYTFSLLAYALSDPPLDGWEDSPCNIKGPWLGLSGGICLLSMRMVSPSSIRFIVGSSLGTSGSLVLVPGVCHLML